MRYRVDLNVNVTTIMFLMSGNLIGLCLYIKSCNAENDHKAECTKFIFWYNNLTARAANAKTTQSYFLGPTSIGITFFI